LKRKLTSTLKHIHATLEADRNRVSAGNKIKQVVQLPAVEITQHTRLHTELEIGKVGVRAAVIHTAAIIIGLLISRDWNKKRFELIPVPKIASQAGDEARQASSRRVGQFLCVCALHS